MATALQSQAVLCNGLYEFADFYDPDNKPEFRDRLASGIRLRRSLPDPLQAIQARDQVQVRVKNVAQWRATPPGHPTVLSAGGGFGMGPAGQTPAGGGDPSTVGTVPIGQELTTYDVTMTDIVAGREGIIGKPAWACLYDLENNVEVFRLDGVIVKARDAAGGPTGIEEGEIVINALDLQAFQQMVPRVRLSERFPLADLGNVAGQDVPVFVVFGTMRKVKLAYLGVFNRRYCFGAFRSPTAGALTFNTVYRNKAVVPSVQYQSITWSGCHVISFAREQVDGSGRLFDIQADVTSTEFTRPSDAGKFILNDATYGLGLPVNTASFTAAATAYAAVSYEVTGGLTQRLQSQVVLNKLALRGAVIDRNSSGQHTWTVDSAGLHANASVELGLGDDRWQNIIRVLDKGQKEIQERVTTLTLQGLFDPGFEGNGSFLLTATRFRDAFLGANIQAEPNEFIGTSLMLDRETDYRYKVLIHGERTLRLLVDIGTSEVPCGRAIRLNNLVPVHIPNLRLDETTATWKVEELVMEASGVEVGLRHYQAGIFTYTPSVVTVGAGASVLTDYSFTLPTVPLDFSVVSSVFVTAGDKTKSAIATLEADAPAVNVTHLVFQIFQNNSAIPLHQREIKVTPGQVGVRMAQRFPVGSGADNTYDLQCFARNTTNTPNFRDGTVAQILNYVVGTDTTPPTTPTGLTAVAGTGKAISLKWTKSTEGVDEYIIFRAQTTISDPPTLPVPGGAVEVGQTKGTVYVDVTVEIGIYYWYWVKSIDQYENPSGFSNRAGPVLPIRQPPDPTPPQNPGPLTFSTNGTYQASDGNTRAFINFNIPTVVGSSGGLPIGAAFMNALYRRNTSSSYLVANQVSVGGGIQHFDDLTPGINYVFALQAFSPDAVGSAVVVATGSPHLAPGDNTVPALVTGLTASDAPPRGLRFRWTAGVEDDLSYYEIQTSTDSGFVASLVTREVDTNEFTATSLINGEVYYARVRGVDYTTNKGPYSLTVSRMVPRTGTDDIGDDTLDTAHYKNLSVTNLKVGLAAIETANIKNLNVTTAKIANAAVTDLQVGSLSAVKITTGLLTVDPAINGATAILVKDAGRVRLRAVVGTPAKIDFEDGSGITQVSLSGTTGGIFFKPSITGQMQIDMGTSGLSFAAVLTHAGLIAITGTTSTAVSGGTLTLAGTTALSLLGPLRTDQITAGVPSGAVNKHVIIRDASGAIQGRFGIYS